MKLPTKLLCTTMMLFALLFNYYGQCDNGTNYYPPSVYEPLPGSWGYLSTCNWGGEVIRLNIVAGDSYQFSTCAERGGEQASYDTQLTLRDGSGALLAYNDDFTGCSGFTSYIYWTATYTGVAYLHLNEYWCANNFVCTQVMMYRTESIALPIELSYFNAYVSDADQSIVTIEWETHSQINNDYFTVYKSYDGFEWFELARVQGAGNANTLLIYETKDERPRVGYQYYKLRQTDYDGQWEEFDIVSVVINDSNPSVIKQFDVLGRPVGDDYRGLIIKMMSDGTTVKVLNFN